MHAIYVGLCWAILVLLEIYIIVCASVRSHSVRYPSLLLEIYLRVYFSIACQEVKNFRRARTKKDQTKTAIEISRYRKNSF